MKKILAILIALSACGDDIAYAPDAALQVADAAIDARPDAPVNRGCMGNLPTSRTITINNGDPIPPNLINELQDVIVAGSRSQFRRPFYPTALRTTTTGGGSLTQVANPANAGYAPVCKIVGGQLSVFFVIPADVGDRFIDLEFELYGDGVPDPTIIVNLVNDMHSAPTVISTLNLLNVPAAWTSYAASMGSAITNAVVPAGGFFLVSLSTADPNLHYGSMTAVLDHP